MNHQQILLIAKGESLESFFAFIVVTDFHRCIQGLMKFVQPILDGICAATGWKATLIAGGLELADGGHLNIIR
jgi:hypothetical protein